MTARMRLINNVGSYVATVMLPKFNTPPEVIVWGIRHFIPTKTLDVYKEAFAVAAVEHEFEANPCIDH